SGDGGGSPPPPSNPALRYVPLLRSEELLVRKRAAMTLIAIEQTRPPAIAAADVLVLMAPGVAPAMTQFMVNRAQEAMAEEVRLSAIPELYALYEEERERDLKGQPSLRGLLEREVVDSGTSVYTTPPKAEALVKALATPDARPAVRQVAAKSL